MDYPKRKPNRLKDFDYSASGAYFVTVCTRNKVCLFGQVGADSISARKKDDDIADARVKGAHSICAEMIDRVFNEALEKFKNMMCPKYVIMPNHIHAVIVIERGDMESPPTISDFIKVFKRYSTIEYIKMVNKRILPPFDKKIWQRSYFDHIIRNEQDYIETLKYIENNPRKWLLNKGEHNESTNPK